MKKNKDYLIEDKLSKIQDLLDKSDIETIIEDKNLIINDIIDDENIQEIDSETFDGYLNIRMDSMKMKLYMELKAPINSDKEITILDIKSKIEVFGPECERRVKWEFVRDFYSKVMFEDLHSGEVVIAEGEPASFHIPEHIILKDGLDIDLKPEIKDGEHVDFHHIHSYIIVGKGEFLGDLIPELPGVNGTNLLGKEIPAPKKTINLLTSGENTTIVHGRIYSEIDGAFKIIENKIIVDPVLLIPKDVDYSTGDITFKGDVNVKNSIREGFAVETDRDLLVEDSIEPSNIICGNNLTVSHGIIGSKKYSIECKGSINALHIEHAVIKCLKEISVEKGIMNSEISSLDKLVIGEKSSIVGGSYFIQNGIIAGNIGNESGIKTNIYLGVDYTVKDKLDQVQINVKELNDVLDHLQKDLSRCETREERDKVKFLFLKVKSRLNSLNNYTRSLLSRLDVNEKSTLTVLGTVYPGTYVEICHLSYLVESSISRVKFSLDKEHGQIKREFI